MILTINLGLLITLIFMRDPTPKTGNTTKIFSFGFLGMLLIIGMILGRI